jgi:dihydroxyacetone kinase
MINNLGGTSNFEMSILANSVVNFLERKNCTISRLYVGSFMTSFDMQGASVSILSLDDKLSDLLDADCSASAWEKADITHGARPSLTELPEFVTAEAISMDNTKYALKHVDIEDFGKNTEAALRAVCKSLIESEPILTKYDIIVGDGDCGMTMERGAKEILSRLESKELNISHPVPLFESLAVAVSASMGGTSGVLVEIMFRKMSSFLKEQSVLNRAAMQLAFEKGVESASFYGGASVGSRTPMRDALSPAVETLKNGQDAAKAAVNGAQSTASMCSASAGISNYLNEDALIGSPDPGAVDVGLVLLAVYETIQ